MGARGPGAKPVKRSQTQAKPAPKRRLRGATRAARVIEFLEGLTITSGAHAGQKLRLRPSQRAILQRIYAEGPDKRRPVRMALISTGRKWGKSTLCAGLALCHLVGPEAVQRGQVVSAAADRGQASIIFRELLAFAEGNAAIWDRLHIKHHEKIIVDVETGSTFMALSSDARKAHGLSTSMAICDEVAQWRGRDLLDALKTGSGAHAEPLLVAISTRSPDPNSPLEEFVKYAEQVEAGDVEDPTFVSAVYSAPHDADAWAEETWHLANPDMDEVRLADIRAQALQAQRMPSLEPAFRAYVLNQPVEPDERFLSREDWEACSGTAEARGPVFGGLDLASGAADLTAFSLYWPETGLLRTWAFLPSAKLAEKEREDRAPYALWRSQGHVIAIPGRAIDRPWLLTWIAEQVEGLDLVGIATDRWGLNDLMAVQDREGLHLPLRPMGMGFRDSTTALRAFETEVMQGKLRHGGSPLGNWALASAKVDSDPAGNRKLSKARSTGRIDPLVAAVIAVGLAAKEPAAPSYEGIGWVAV